MIDKELADLVRKNIGIVGAALCEYQHHMKKLSENSMMDGVIRKGAAKSSKDAKMIQHKLGLWTE